MKPVLLNNIKDYPKSGLGRITTATNQQVHEVYNGDYTFSFDMLVTDKLFTKVKEEMIIATFVSKLDTDFLYEINHFFTTLNKLLENTEKILYTVFAS